MYDAYSTSQTRQVTCQVLHSHRGLVVPNWTGWLKKLFKKKKVRPVVMQGTPLRRSRGSRSEISLMASPPPGSPDYLSSVSPDESLKLIQSYCQSLKAANNLSLSHTLTTHTHTLIHISWEASNCLLLCMDLTKSDSTLHKNLRGPRNVTHRLEISSGLHMSS